jgi:hypothetical protein
VTISLPARLTRQTQEPQIALVAPQWLTKHQLLRVINVATVILGIIDALSCATRAMYLWPTETTLISTIVLALSVNALSFMAMLRFGWRN